MVLRYFLSWDNEKLTTAVRDHRWLPLSEWNIYLKQVFCYCSIRNASFFLLYTDLYFQATPSGWPRIWPIMILSWTNIFSIGIPAYSRWFLITTEQVAVSSFLLKSYWKRRWRLIRDFSQNAVFRLYRESSFSSEIRSQTVCSIALASCCLRCRFSHCSATSALSWLGSEARRCNKSDRQCRSLKKSDALYYLAQLAYALATTVCFREHAKRMTK